MVDSLEALKAFDGAVGSSIRDFGVNPRRFIDLP
jgi:hypothetical protein